MGTTRRKVYVVLLSNSIPSPCYRIAESTYIIIVVISSSRIIGRQREQGDKSNTRHHLSPRPASKNRIMVSDRRKWTLVPKKTIDGLAVAGMIRQAKKRPTSDGDPVVRFRHPPPKNDGGASNRMIELFFHSDSELAKDEDKRQRLMRSDLTYRCTYRRRRHHQRSCWSWRGVAWRENFGSWRSGGIVQSARQISHPALWAFNFGGTCVCG
jgi:hypothetical protein